MRKFVFMCVQVWVCLGRIYVIYFSFAKSNINLIIRHICFIVYSAFDKIVIIFV